MSYLITGGRVITVQDDRLLDVLVEGEQVVALGHNLEVPPGTITLDATGKYVFPGFIDPHVHIHLPFMGTEAADTHASASRAALVGGTTTLIEMCCPARSDDPLAALDLWQTKAESMCCDYSFHMGITRFDDATPDVVQEVVRRGIASLKVFLAYEGAFAISDAELYQTLQFAKQEGLIVTAHCENAAAIAARQRELLAAGKTGPEWHGLSRPPCVEALGVQHLATFAELTGASVYCVHTSCQEALEAAARAQDRGVNLWVEAVLPHLVLDESYAERADFEGAKYVMSPPLRATEHQQVLWDGLASGLVSTVATDHAPFNFVGQKEMGRDDFTKIPNGIPSVEHRVDLLFTHGVAAGRLGLKRFVELGSTAAAKLMGLYPRKGTVAVGSDADLVIYDPEYRGTLTQSSQTMNVDYSAFEGWPVQGRSETVLLRGQVQVEAGRFVGGAASGQFLGRQPSHF